MKRQPIGHIRRHPLFNFNFDILFKRLHRLSQDNLETGCREWMSAKNKLGYGLISISEGKKHVGKNFLAHRVALALATGHAPPEKGAAHACHNPSCINVAHLRWATFRENMQDNLRIGKRAGWYCAPKLDETKVHQIRQLIRLSVPLTRIAHFYGVSRTTISDLKKGRNWAWIEEAT